jgi:hypothetical protein
MGALGHRLAASPCGCDPRNGERRRKAEIITKTTKIFRMETMLEANLARIRTHRNNIHRYRGLLRTELSDLEREFIEKRMADEQTALDVLVAETFPVKFPFPKDSASSSSVGAVS